MPFTVSHIVAVLPLTAGRPGRMFVPGALVIGSMVPDLPYFVPPHVGSDWSHAPWGVVTTDLLFGTALYALWSLLLARPLTDLAPAWLRARLPHRPRTSALPWLRVALSVLVGATTHVVWDTFTHPDRWGTRHVGWLTAEHGILPGFKWMQYGSGVLGLAVLAGWVAHRLLRTAPDRQRLTSSGQSVASDRARAACWLVTVAVFATSVAGTWAAGVRRTGQWFEEAVAVQIATRTIGLTMATVVVLCLVWQVLSDRQLSSSRGDHG